jgi:excisionase family DNA binding protein
VIPLVNRSPADYVIGANGPGVFIPGPFCVWMTKRLRLDEVRITERGKNPEVDAILLAISAVEKEWRARQEQASTTGTVSAPNPEPATPWNYLSTQQVADRLKVSRRRVTAAINEGILPARMLDGRWLITEDDFNTYRAARAA